MAFPYISVIITTHKRPNLLARALNSLTQQVFQDFEIILCADEGTKNTKSIAELLLREKDTFLVLPNVKGPAGTRNSGISVAKGHYICFLDDDDTFDPGYFATFSNLVPSKNNLYYYNYSEISEVRTESGIQTNCSKAISQKERCVADLRIANFIPNNSFFIEQSIANKYSFDTHLASHEDWDYLIGISEYVNFNHVDLMGPNIHLSKSGHRNELAKKTGGIALDFLSIYRKWPSFTGDEAMKRKKFIRHLGLKVDETAL
jgi:glycosyltransferase involved in cell wall biosynthesis